MPTTAGSIRTTRSRSRITTIPPHGLSCLRVINDDRVAGGPGLRAASASRHGDHLLRARRRARAQGHDGHRRGDPPRRRAAHERGHRRRAQRVQRVEDRARALSPDLARCRSQRGSRRATSRRRSRTPTSAARCASSLRPTAPTAASRSTPMPASTRACSAPATCGARARARSTLLGARRARQHQSGQRSVRRRRRDRRESHVRVDGVDEGEVIHLRPCVTGANRRRFDHPRDMAEILDEDAAAHRATGCSRSSVSSADTRPIGFRGARRNRRRVSYACPRRRDRRRLSRARSDQSPSRAGRDRMAPRTRAAACPRRWRASRLLAPEHIPRIDLDDDRGHADAAALDHAPRFFTERLPHARRCPTRRA